MLSIEGILSQHLELRSRLEHRGHALDQAVAVGAALALGTGMAFARVMAGGHFASDVLFAGVFTFLIIWLAYAVIFRWPSTRLDEDESERRLERFSARCRRLIGLG